MKNPEIFLAQEDVPLLVQALTMFALEVDAADDRKDTLVNAGIHLAFRSNLTFESRPLLFANKLVARFREYHVQGYQPIYHPMVSLLEYLLQTHELEEQDRNLFNRLLKRGMDNFNGLTARSAVGRIESPPGTAIGTGVLVDRQSLLTCYHVFERIFEHGHDQAWVRFGYKTGRYGIETGEVFELETKSIARSASPSDHMLDYALVRIIGKPKSHPASLSSSVLSSAQPIRLIHHPRGDPVQFSDIGQIVQVDQEHIKHNILTEYGSSGAPILDMDWQVVALHRGTLSLSRPSPPGITEGIPIFSIWDDIKHHLQLSTLGFGSHQTF